ncbi:hypothetical protein [Microbispora sp. GKU 823]|uniref:hypothetical protein n=1 Tax=Microbispora sp. GKU 823 TaxID=1652100 RepID=UPI0009A384F6|nr:hypothetical protein [Microbispora sp. GKU 823]OPG13698.1 hypothetical protein B1L11_06845 [Microbispora sp. GKU 823]
MADRVDVADVRELLTAIRESLTAPRHASYEYAEASKQLLVDRAAAVRGVLTSFIKHRGEADLLKEARILRELVAENAPVTYPVREAEVPVPVDLADDEPAGGDR